MDVIQRNMTSSRTSTRSRLIAMTTVMVLVLHIPPLTSSSLSSSSSGWSSMPSCARFCNCTRSPWTLNDGLHRPALPQYGESLGNCICQGNGLIPDEFLDVLGMTVEYFDHVVLDNGSFTDSSFVGLHQLTLSGVQYIKPGGFRAVAGHGIRKLIFRDTFMTVLEKNVFMDLYKLWEIVAAGNNINALKDGCFEGLSELRNLSLVNNSIWGVSRDNFLGLEGLQRLYLSKNNLVRLTPRTFELMPALQDLWIEYNAIVRIERGAFLNLAKLERLRLDGNQIQVVPEPLFRVNQQGFLEVSVVLHNNPLQCDCRMNWVADWLDMEGIQCLGSCQAPDKFKGRTLVSVYRDPLSHCRDNNSVIRANEGSMTILTCPIAHASWVVPGNITLQDCGQSHGDHYYLTNSDSLVVWNTQLQQRGTYECVSEERDQLRMVYHLNVKYMSKAHIEIIAVSVPAVILGVLAAVMFLCIRRCCRRRGYQKMKNDQGAKGTDPHLVVQYKGLARDPIDVGGAVANPSGDHLENNSTNEVLAYNNINFNTKPNDQIEKDIKGIAQCW